QHPCIPLLSCDGGDMQYPSVPLVDHMRQHRPRGIKAADEIYLEYLVQIGTVYLMTYDIRLTRDPRAIDKDVDLYKTTRHILYGLLDQGPVAHIDGYRNR